MKKLLLILALTITSSAFAASSCKSFLLNTTVYNSSITYEKICYSESEFDISIKTTIAGNSVEVSSETLSSNEVDVKKAISLKITEGFTKNEQAAFRDLLGPALRSGDMVSAKMTLIDIVLGSYN
jgi:hypothetical protein